MATNTQEYNFQKPEVGGDSDNWGDMLNGNWDITDSLLRGATQLSNIGIGATNTTIPLVCNAASEADITATFSGKVGIGTTSPASKLHIDSGATDEVLRLEGTGSPYLSFYDTGVRQSYIGSTGNTLEIHGDTPDTNIALYTANTERMRIDSSGNVGIGTDSPAGNLHISAGTDGDATLILEADTDQLGSEADNPRLELRQDGHEVEGSIYMEGDGDQTATDTLGNALVIDTKNFHGNNDIQFATGGALDPDNLANSSVRMTINDSGNVGIGTNAPTHPLMVQRADDTLGNASISLHPRYESGDGSYIRWGGTAAASTMLRFVGTGDVERMRITGDGDVLVGTTDQTLYNNNGSDANSNGILLTDDGRIEAARWQGTAASLNRMGNDGTVLNFYNRGLIEGYINTTQSGVSLVSVSDQRLKENITDSGDAGSTIDAIQVRQFDWIANGKHEDYGFVAQELANAVPDAVYTGEDEDETMGVDYSKLVPILVKEVQALRARVAELEENA